MATPNFTALVDKVSDWSNRDTTALPTSVIQDALRYAADKAYHMLETPPLEATITYTALTREDLAANSDRLGRDVITLPIPSDLSRFIFLRTTGDRGIVFNEKTDVRTGWDMSADTYSHGGFWYRQGNNIYVAGLLDVGNVFELHYYKRLPALNALYAVNQSNIDANVITYVETPTQDQTDDTDNRNANTATFETSLPVDPDADPVVNMDVQGFYQSDVSAADRADDTAAVNDLTQTGLWIPTEAPNWLRDENEKILLFGALMESGSYLQDDAMYGQYQQRYQQEIQDLNNEDKKRTASGGNIQMHFNGRGLI